MGKAILPLTIIVSSILEQIVERKFIAFALGDVLLPCINEQVRSRTKIYRTRGCTSMYCLTGLANLVSGSSFSIGRISGGFTLISLEPPQQLSQYA